MTSSMDCFNLFFDKLNEKSNIVHIELAKMYFKLLALFFWTNVITLSTIRKQFDKVYCRNEQNNGITLQRNERASVIIESRVFFPKIDRKSDSAYTSPIKHHSFRWPKILLYLGVKDLQGLAFLLTKAT